MKTKLKALSLLLILSATSACVTASTVPVVSDYCRIAAPISYDATKDTVETVAEIEAHNSKYACVCDNDCPTTVKTGEK